MALVSPGIQISINDQSQYVSNNVGSVPLVVLATAQDKMYNGSAAIGTSKAYAGKLQSFTSQRDLVTAMGTPTFQLSSAGTPINGSELNEYGLLTAYSALGLGNQLFAIRADIDLNELRGTSVRPVGVEADGTYWFNLASSEFGIYSLNSAANSGVGAFNSIDSSLLKITDQTQVTTTGSGATQVSTPISSIGQQGSYALVFVNSDGTTPSVVRLFYKATSVSLASANLTNTWVQVGSTLWQQSTAAATGTSSVSNIASGNDSLTINGHTVIAGSTSPAGFVTVINAVTHLTGVSATVDALGHLVLFITSSANGGAGSAVISDNGAGTVLAKLGLGNGTGTVTYYCPYFYYGTYAQQPAGGWFATDSQPRPTGSIWWKTTATGTGWSPVLSQYSANLDTWSPLSVPLFVAPFDAIYGLDPAAGGANIPVGQVIALDGSIDTVSVNSLRFFVNQGGSTTVGTGGQPLSSGAFQASDVFTIAATVPGSSDVGTLHSITTTGSTAATFVSDILNANIPYVTAQVNADGTISITHTAGGAIIITPISSTTVLLNAGFGQIGTSDTVLEVPSTTGQFVITNFTEITSEIKYSATTPYANPADGTLWYYSNPADVDVLINNGQVWKGYQNVTSDVRGYNLTHTDPSGVIVSASQPTSQTDGTPLVAGDLWLDSSDLVNYPSLYRYNGVGFVAIDNTDHVSNSGIIFADARWAPNGSTDPVTGSFPSIVTLLKSDYIDLDAPDPRLYPRGTLLFNTRRSGFNVKKFVSNYFNSTSFPNVGTNGQGYPTTLPAMATGGNDAWVSASGLNESGVMYAGPAAQRNLVVTALQSAVNSNTDVLDANYKFNLLVAPGYPELIPSLVTLNDNRGDTGFVIGDTPMTLAPNTTDLTAWNNNTGIYAGKGMTTASPYLAVYYPAGLTTDLAGNTVAVPASHAALRTFLYNDQVSYPWFAPAGATRGLVSNLSDIGYVSAASGEFIHNGINQGLRDSLYTLNINPIAQLPGVGLVIWGQETRSGTTTARNRVNVVRLENYLRVIFASISNSYLFEPNDTITRKSIATQIESSLNNLLSLRGLYDFLVICDTSNNTSSTIANGQLYVDVAIEPMRDVEFIYIPIAIYNPGTIASLGVAST